MLSHLQLRDFVLVDQAELELKPGMTALTGETGAGKSIVVDALLLIAGGRGTGDVVRQGAERAEVTASFDSLPTPAKAWLEAQSIDHDGELVVRRVIGADGRSRAYVNGQVVPIQALRELRRFAHRDPRPARIPAPGEPRHAARNARRACGGGPARARGRALPTLPRLPGEFEALQAAAQNRDARLDLLRYQLTELEAEVTTRPEIEELLADRKRIAGRGRLALAARAALTAVYDVGCRQRPRSARPRDRGAQKSC